MTLRKEFDGLVAEHIDGTPSIRSTQRLDEILTKKPKLRQEFSEQVMMHRLLSECCRPAPGRRPFDLSACPPVPERPLLLRICDAIRRVFQPSYCPTCRRGR
jgi:hypothetical protein